MYWYDSCLIVPVLPVRCMPGCSSSCSPMFSSAILNFRSPTFMMTRCCRQYCHQCRYRVHEMSSDSGRVDRW
ncbi:hypothetical protein AcW1_000850 [Taiwanofungus camphoratus]|nr:hypothetical protein AcW1_000850 [Antrodia cinnamomea]